MSYWLFFKFGTLIAYIRVELFVCVLYIKYTMALSAHYSTVVAFKYQH